jgi:hypothetical protein
MTDVKLVGEDESSVGYHYSANWLLCGSFTAVKSGTLKSLRIKCTGSGNVMMAIYNNNSSAPQHVLVSSGSSAVVTGWNTINVSDLTITSGTVYWLACISDAAIISYHGNSGGTFKANSTTYSGFTFPDPYVVVGSDTKTFHIAGWGTEASGSLVSSGSRRRFQPLLVR